MAGTGAYSNGKTLKSSFHMPGVVNTEVFVVDIPETINDITYTPTKFAGTPVEGTAGAVSKCSWINGYAGINHNDIDCVLLKGKDKTHYN
jgi:hypothetical protein